MCAEAASGRSNRIGLVAETSAVASFGGAILQLAIALGLTMLIYWVGLPPAARRRMPIFPGAAFAVIAHIALGYGYAFLIAKTGDGGAYQAGLGVIGLTLTSLYLSSVAVLVGVEINEYLGEQLAGPSHGHVACSASHAQNAQA